MTLAAAARSAGSALLDLLLPQVCVVCERLLASGEHGPVCGHCWARCQALPHPRCARCGHPGDGYACRWCAQLAPYVRAARSVAWVPGGTAGAIVHALKYAGWTRAADGMAERMARLDWPPDVVEERAAVVPVPLAPVRERERGFNQSALLAAALGARWGVPVRADALARTRATESQTRLTPDGRRANVRGAFRAVPHAMRDLRGRHLVLVDDVVTTASTVSECAAALFDAGARVVSIATFGRAPAAGDRAARQDDRSGSR